MQIDCDVEGQPSKASGERHVASDAPQTSRPRNDDHVVEVWIASNQWRRRRFDEICEVRVGIGPPQAPHDRRGEDYIADEPRADEENPQGSIVASSMSITGMSSLMG